MSASTPVGNATLDVSRGLDSQLLDQANSIVEQYATVRGKASGLSFRCESFLRLLRRYRSWRTTRESEKMRVAEKMIEVLAKVSADEVKRGSEANGVEESGSVTLPEEMFVTVLGIVKDYATAGMTGDIQGRCETFQKSKLSSKREEVAHQLIQALVKGSGGEEKERLRRRQDRAGGSDAVQGDDSESMRIRANTRATDGAKVFDPPSLLDPWGSGDTDWLSLFGPDRDP
ncbi:hypothetical protein C8R46DRAFT_1226056 [Mycena filopes]|nr:hypothetical protein C8R46DRAFT_1226056 [Mycena filopes]